MKIAIIGGSIAGCALGAILQGEHDITIYERSQSLESKGAGITILNPLLAQLKTLGLLDDDTISYSFAQRSFYHDLPEHSDLGSCIWNQNISIASLHWDTLFTNLRARIPDTIYKKGQHVAHVEFDTESARITLDSGYSEEFDLAIFADGHQSMGRSLISDKSDISYAGYVAWRGVYDFDSLSNQEPFTDTIPYYCFDTGHLLAYAVNHHGTKMLNWVFYEKITLENLEKLGNISLANFSDIAKKHLYQLAENKLPGDIAHIVKDTETPFAQKIFSANISQFVKGRAVLLGDSGLVLKPHVGSGAASAIQDALNLCKYLSEHSLDEALKLWEESTLASRLPTYELSQRMAEALVLNPVPWQDMDNERMTAWWSMILKGEQWYPVDSEEKVPSSLSMQ